MSKPHVLLLPGMMLDHRMWQRQVAALEALAACRVADLSAGDSMDGFAGAELARSPERLHLIGFSMGAIVAVAMWRMAPQRIGSMTLMGFSPHADDPARKAPRLRHAARAERGELAALIREDFAPRYFARGATSGDIGRWTGAVVDMAVSLGADVFRRQTMAQIGRADSVPSLQGIRVPVLLLRGADDQLVSADDQALMRARIPDARYQAIEDAGHMLTLEQPDAVNASLLQFLQDMIDEQYQKIQDPGSPAGLCGG
ncbi:MAG: alpha/beta fold hydrolase [Lautropia sp.]